VSQLDFIQPKSGVNASFRYALVSAQGKGQPKYVRMRGQTVEEVLTKTEYTSAVCLTQEFIQAMN